MRKPNGCVDRQMLVAQGSTYTLRTHLTPPSLSTPNNPTNDQGGLTEFNFLMSRDPDMQREFRRVNARHSAIRRQLAEPEQLRPYVEKLGPAVVEQILASGIAGVSPDKTEDLKCLHAHLADFLCTRTWP